MDSIDFTDLLSHGIQLMDVDTMMRTKPDSLQAKYKKPTLRKAKMLKKYKR